MIRCKCSLERKRHAAKLQRGALCRDEEEEEETGDRDDALVRVLHGHPLVRRNAVVEKVVALVMVARANAEERGERVGERCSGTALGGCAPVGNQAARRWPNQRRAKPTMRLEQR